MIGSLEESAVFRQSVSAVLYLLFILFCLKFELRFDLICPGYQFCGPGTRLEKQLARGDRGINLLDAACREHDIAYSHSNDLVERQVADNILAEKARKRITASDSTLRERAAATAIWAAMNAKTKIDMGLKQRRRRRARGFFRQRNAAARRPARSTAARRSPIIGRRGGGSR
ncbi:hypothetical protein ALC57_01873 [Trachymyrmex cornetzi]|uniref:Phospholipase A2-like domain-containing protein n=1 Tax=Trachymyrmex cornetzi TaxID=471704 RepID=A0A151JPT1_9HYME|nr:hypothetical protein ALC57_01873 [Trachymyrmex cornetzi]